MTPTRLILLAAFIAMAAFEMSRDSLHDCYMARANYCNVEELAP